MERWTEEDVLHLQAACCPFNRKHTLNLTHTCIEKHAETLEPNDLAASHWRAFWRMSEFDVCLCVGRRGQLKRRFCRDRPTRKPWAAAWWMRSRTWSAISLWGNSESSSVSMRTPSVTRMTSKKVILVQSYKGEGGLLVHQADELLERVPLHRYRPVVWVLSGGWEWNLPLGRLG